MGGDVVIEGGTGTVGGSVYLQAGSGIFLSLSELQFREIVDFLLDGFPFAAFACRSVY